MVNSQTAFDCATGATTEVTAGKAMVFPQKNYLGGTPKKVPELSSAINHLLYFLP